MGFTSVDVEDDQFAYRYDTQLLIDRRDKDLDEEEIADYVDEKKTQIGYEISFTKYFYKPVELRSMEDIWESLKALERETDGMMAEIMEGIQ